MLIFLIAIMGVGLVFYFIIKPVLKRRKAEGGIQQPLEENNSMPEAPVDLIQVKEIEMTNV